jgi:hypothetical protein
MQINEILNEMRYLCNYISKAINQIFLRNKYQIQELLNLFRKNKIIILLKLYNYVTSFTSFPKYEKKV